MEFLDRIVDLKNSRSCKKKFKRKDIQKMRKKTFKMATNRLKVKGLVPDKPHVSIEKLKSRANPFYVSTFDVILLYYRISYFIRQVIIWNLYGHLSSYRSGTYGLVVRWCILNYVLVSSNVSLNLTKLYFKMYQIMLTLIP